MNNALRRLGRQAEPDPSGYADDGSRAQRRSTTKGRTARPAEVRHTTTESVREFIRGDRGLPTPLTSLRHHPLLATLLCVLGLGLGLGSALVSPVTYTAEGRIAVGGNDLSAQALPGYALGSQELAASYARYVNNSAAQAGSNPAAGVTVQASPIPESNIIRVEGLAPTADQSVAAAKQASEALVAQVNAIKAQNDPAKVLDQVAQLSQEVARVQQTVDDAAGQVSRLQSEIPQSATGLAQAKATLVQVRTELATASVRRDAINDRYRGLVVESKTGVNLLEVRAAAVVKNDRSGTLQRYGVAGLGLGIVLALVGAVALDRRRYARSMGSAGTPLI